MKGVSVPAILLALLVLGSRELQAQPYGYYYWDPRYQQYLQYQ
jgi:hypothetical protein